MTSALDAPDGPVLVRHTNGSLSIDREHDILELLNAAHTRLVSRIDLLGGSRVGSCRLVLLGLEVPAPLFGISKSAADHVLDRLAPLLAISPAGGPAAAPGHRPHRRRHPGAHPRPQHRRLQQELPFRTNLQVVIDANSRLVGTIGLPLPAAATTAWRSRSPALTGPAGEPRPSPTADTGAPAWLIPHRKRRGQTHLSPQQEAENPVHRRGRAWVDHALSRLKNRQSCGTAASKATAFAKRCSTSPGSTT